MPSFSPRGAFTRPRYSPPAFSDVSITGGQTLPSGTSTWTDNSEAVPGPFWHLKSLSSREFHQLSEYIWVRGVIPKTQNVIHELVQVNELISLYDTGTVRRPSVDFQDPSLRLLNGAGAAIVLIGAAIANR